MAVAVRYQSRGGNTQRIADAIAGAAGVRAEPVGTALAGPVSLLFIGGGVYAGHMDKALREFLEGLTPEMARRVAVFSTAMGPTTLVEEVKGIVAPRGIAVASDAFHCKGRFLLFNKGLPNDGDLRAAEEFARRMARAEA